VTSSPPRRDELASRTRVEVLVFEQWG